MMQAVHGSLVTAPGSVSRRRAQIGRLVMLGGIVALHVVPTHAVDSGPVLCPFRRVTGLPCPGCGMTRSLSLAAHWHFGRAAHLHPFGPALYLVLLAIGVGLLVSWTSRLRDVWRRIRTSATMRVVVGAAAGGWLVWGVARAVRVAIHHDPSW